MAWRAGITDALVWGIDEMMQGGPAAAGERKEILGGAGRIHRIASPARSSAPRTYPTRPLSRGGRRVHDIIVFSIVNMFSSFLF